MWIIVDHNDDNKPIGPFTTSQQAWQWLREKGYSGTDAVKHSIRVYELHAPSAATIDETK